MFDKRFFEVTWKYSFHDELIDCCSDEESNSIKTIFYEHWGYGITLTALGRILPDSFGNTVKGLKELRTGAVEHWATGGASDTLGLPG